MPALGSGLVLLVVTALVGTTGVLVSARLAEGSLAQLLVGAYVVAFSEIVLFSLLLSPGSNLNRWTLLAAILVVFVVALATARGARFPPIRPAARAVVEALREPTVATVAIAAAGVVVYSVALGLFTPSNEEDALHYHLARAAFWRQQGAVGYVDGALNAQINGYPPNGEIAMAFTMIVSGSSRFAPLVQLGAALAAAVAVYGIARRLGFGLHAGVFGALIFVTLPVVALQASTGLNDVVVASLVASATFFLLRGTPRNLFLAGAAVALLVGSKLTGILALAVLALVAIAARRHRPLPALTAIAIGAAVGAYQYVINVVETDDVSGGIAGERVTADAAEALARVIRLAIDAIELPGAIGLDRLLYVVAAAVLAAVALAVRGSRRQKARQAAVAAGATLVPLAFPAFADLLVRGNQKLFFELGRADVGYLDPARSTTKASPVFSWYGPLGVLLGLVACVLVVQSVRQRLLPPVALALAAAPVLWIVIVGIAVPYFEWNGRWMMGGFALAAATWGSVLRVPPLAWAAAAIAALTTVLAFIHLHDKPSGLRLIEPTREHSVWSQPDWAVQATDHPYLRALFRFVDRNVPDNARLALTPNVWPGDSDEGGNLPPFPFFGEDLGRTILFANSLRDARAVRADWAILRSRGVGACAPGWDAVFRYGVWIVVRRTRTACAAGSAARSLSSPIR
jgi:glycosyl transferase family 87